MPWASLKRDSVAAPEPRKVNMRCNEPKMASSNNSAFTRYCNCQYCVVYICNNEGSEGNVILRNSAGGDGVGWGT